MNNFKEYLFIFLVLVKNKNILKIIFFSFLFSVVLFSLVFFYVWDLAPSVKWMQFIIGSLYYDLLEIFWKFVIFSVLIFLIPIFFSITVSFFLDDIVEEVYFTISEKQNIEIKSLSYFSGIIVGIKIFIYSMVIFLFVIFLKLFVVSNNLAILIIQFLLSSYIIAKGLVKYKTCVQSKQAVNSGAGSHSMSLTN